MINGLGRYRRILKYLKNLERKSKTGSTKETKALLKKLKFIGYKLRTLEMIRIIAFILLYSSVTSAVISAIPGFESFSKTVIKLSSLIGSTIFLIMVGITSKLISWYLTDLQLISNELIAIYKR